MSDKYDSILQEKKVYEDYVPTHPAFKKFMNLGIFLVLIIVCISYVVYYNTFLNGETILLNDLLKLVDNYSIMFNGLEGNYSLSNNYMLNGSVSGDNIKYEYSFIKDNNKTIRKFSNSGKDVSFYYDGDSNYIKLSGMDKYISLENNLLSFDDYNNDIDIINRSIFDYFNYIIFNNNISDMYHRFFTIDNYDSVISDIRNNFLDYVSDNNYSKKFYFYNGRPVVKIDLSLDSKAINKILGNGDNNLLVKDDYNVIITTRNDAIMNDIKSIKVIINNKTKKTRVTLESDGNDITYVDKDGNQYRYNLDINNDKYNLRIYNGDVLYSAIEGYKDNGKYIYNYQFIDKAERYSLEVLYDNNKYNYKLISNVENVTKNIVIDGEYFSDGAISSENIDVILYRNISDGDRNIINDKLVNYLK